MPDIPVGPAGEPPRRSRGKTIGAVVGVTALIAAGAFAVVSISGNDDAGGAASPTEVGTQLTAALDNEDVLGVIDLLLPGERDTFRDPIIRTVDNLVRLEVLDPEASLSDVGGIDVQFADVEVREEPTNVDDIVNIFLSGSATVTVDGDEVPIGDLLLDEAFGGDRPDMTAEPDSEDFEDVQMTVVERDGRWYLSAFYSAAEQARGDADIPTEGVEASGADEPALALDQMLEAISDQDLEDLIAVLDPTEAEALQRYAPLFLDDAQAEIDDLGVPWSIDDREFTVEGSGSRRTVSVDGFRLTITEPRDGTEVVVTFADSCLTIDVEGDVLESCGVGEGDLGDLAGDLDLGDDGAFTDLLDTLGAAFDDYDPSGIAVHEVEGQWYVSPLATGFDALNDVLDALDRDELTDLIDAFERLGELDDFTDLPGIVEGGTDMGEGSDPGDPGDLDGDALSACYQELDAAAGVQCMQDGIASGAIDPEIVNPPFRFPECGAAEAYWIDVYSMADAEFVAVVEAASPCFLGLVAAGELDAYMLPSELLDPSCLEGRNWYTASDPEYTDRFFACAAAALTELSG